MTDTRMFPRPMTTEHLLAILDDIRARVAAGDSFEGSIAWEMPIPDEGQPDYPPDIQFLVHGGYRIGNSMGQGGFRMVGELRQVKS